MYTIDTAKLWGNSFINSFIHFWFLPYFPHSTICMNNWSPYLEFAAHLERKKKNALTNQKPQLHVNRCTDFWRWRRHSCAPRLSPSRHLAASLLHRAYWKQQEMLLRRERILSALQTAAMRSQRDVITWCHVTIKAGTLRRGSCLVLPPSTYRNIYSIRRDGMTKVVVPLYYIKRSDLYSCTCTWPWVHQA